MFLVKEVAKNLGITTQAIYKQREELERKGYMQTNSNGDLEITLEGFNYLQDKKSKQIKQQNNGLKDVAQKNTDKSINYDELGLQTTLLNFYEKRIEELKESYEKQLQEQKQQVDYFKEQYEKEKEERIKTNAQYQTFLLGTAEDNKKAHWWHFRKN